jgi:hypothetical protein
MIPPGVGFYDNQARSRSLRRAYKDDDPKNGVALVSIS